MSAGAAVVTAAGVGLATTLMLAVASFYAAWPGMVAGAAFVALLTTGYFLWLLSKV